MELDPYGNVIGSGKGYLAYCGKALLTKGKRKKRGRVTSIALEYLARERDN